MFNFFSSLLHTMPKLFHQNLCIKAVLNIATKLQRIRVMQAVTGQTDWESEPTRDVSSPNLQSSVLVHTNNRHEVKWTHKTIKTSRWVPGCACESLAFVFLWICDGIKWNACVSSLIYVHMYVNVRLWRAGGRERWHQHGPQELV